MSEKIREAIDELIQDICEICEPPESDERAVRVNLDWLRRKIEEMQAALRTHENVGQESEAGAVDAQNIPTEAIGRILAEVMDAAVANGANSVSMPDHYVEVAAWLCSANISVPPSAPAIEDEKKGK